MATITIEVKIFGVVLSHLETFVGEALVGVALFPVGKEGYAGRSVTQLLWRQGFPISWEATQNAAAKVNGEGELTSTAVKTPIKTTKVRQFSLYAREIIAAVEGGMSRHLNGHRTKRYKVEARNVPHNPCFVPVGVGGCTCRAGGGGSPSSC